MNVIGKSDRGIIFFLSRVFIAIIVVLLFLGGIDLIMYLLPAKIVISSVFNESENWLVLFAKINLGIIYKENLSIFHWIDYALLVAIGIAFILQFIKIKRKNLLTIIFGCIAIISPFLGIYLLVTTHTAGRTGLLTATFILSIIMFFGNQFKKIIGITGCFASIGLLIICDYLSAQKSETFYAYLIFVFYFAWITWFIMLGFKDKVEI